MRACVCFHVYTYTYTYTYTCADTYTYAYAYIYTYALTYAYAYSFTYAYAKVAGMPNADGDGGEDAAKGTLEQRAELTEKITKLAGRSTAQALESAAATGNVSRYDAFVIYTCMCLCIRTPAGNLTYA